MGKASRWIRNLLMGKKEEKMNNKAIISALTPLSQSQSQSQSQSPSERRRRWSFRRSNNTEKVSIISHKSCRSFDSQLFHYSLIHHQPPPNVYIGSHMVAVASATKIQAAFRSYLARKALCALRGLVKLQALVRGHLVRKRTTTMVRCMKALVSIQVRARYQRIQLVEDAESRSLTKRGSMMAHKRRLSASQYDHNETIGHFGSKTSTCIRYRQSSRRFSIDSLPSTHDKSMRLHDKLIDEVSTKSQMNTQNTEPNYMTRTKSSRAKTRSHSEPRQRPTKQNRGNRQNEDLGAIRKEVQTHNHQKDHEGWLAKLRTSSNSSSDFEFDSASTCTNSSSYRTALYAYGVHKSSNLI
ncbi:protein of unknown function DUF4005 [Cynara cardunculus var. scolymus]|uniref:DUF4005 domain-containing protein n=1 Tax=Cynara cardunculus var. scolymus TaxID=59895 RepID=A0A103XK17_CYNCS|nr:protein of unknown function DUF4005 [Cynara cardunculus var. scolymus]